MSSTKCYVWNFDSSKAVVADPNFDQPCPSGGGCCNPGDTCVGSFMCKHKEQATDPNRPDYYVSGCTDASYSSSACTRFCSKYTRTGVVYNTTSNLWACCGTIKVNGTFQTTCANPTSDTFALAAPAQLPVIGIAGGPAASSTISTSTTSTATSSATSDAASASASPGSGDGGLSTGAQVGLGVGLGLGIAIIVAAVAFLFIRRRKKSRAAASLGHDQHSSISKPGPKDAYYAPPKLDVPPSYGLYKNQPLQNSGTHLIGETHELGEYGSRHNELPTVARAELA